MTSTGRMVRLVGKQSERSATLHRWLTPYQAVNAFNPSVRSRGDQVWVAFRHWGSGRRPPFEASLLSGSWDADSPAIVNLTEHARRFDVQNVADPKLLELEGEIWLTFNDGWSATENQLYLMRVTPSLGRPHRCVYGPRQAVEKNWAFFSSEGGIRALYSLNPVRVLGADMPEATDSSIRFEPCSEAAPSSFGDLSIGTQLCEFGDRHVLVAHEKWRVATMRAYLGRWVSIENLRREPSVSVSRRRLYHSRRDLLGGSPRHNKHLLSCTYFSGMQVEDGRALLSYGINDLRCGFADVRVSQL